MECVGTDCKQNTRVDFVLEIKMQNSPCFARKCDFCVQGCLRDEWLVFLAHRDVQNLFGMLARVEYIRCSSCVVLAS